MKKLTKGILLSSVLAVVLLSTGTVYAQEAGTIDDQDIETIQLIAVGATIGGSLIAVIQGYADAPKEATFSIKKLTSAMITAVTGSFLLVNLGMLPSETNGMTLLGVVIAYLVLGYGGDKGLSQLDK